MNALVFGMSAAMLLLMVKNDHDFNEHTARMAELSRVVSLGFQGLLDEQARLGTKLDRVGDATEAGAGQGAKLVQLQLDYLKAVREGREADRKAIFNQIKNLTQERAPKPGRTPPEKPRTDHPPVGSFHTSADESARH